MNVNRLWTLLIAISMVFWMGCEEKKDNAAGDKGGGGGAATADAAAAAPPADAAAAKPEAPADATAAAPEEKPEKPEEYINFVIKHEKDGSPVNGAFKNFNLEKAVVNLEDMSKSMAMYSVDISSVDTGKPKRDSHLQQPDIFDVAQFAKATFTVDGVEPAEGEDTYKANATLNLHGVEKAVPVTFTIVEKNEDGSITIEGQSSLKRTEFGVGSPPGDPLNAKDEVQVNVRLKLANKG